MKVRIIGTDPPGGPGVRVGVQRGSETVFAVPAVSDVRFEFDVTVKDEDFRGPFVHGRRGERFLYLVWSQDGQMFRRAKLMLPALFGELLQARLGLTDAKGGPVCAAVRPPAITWELLE